MLTKKEKKNMNAKSVNPLSEQGNKKVYFNYQL